LFLENSYFPFDASGLGGRGFKNFKKHEATTEVYLQWEFVWEKMMFQRKEVGN
jgi:hypothetical protein